MIFSVYNDAAKSYDYYESPGAGPTHAPPATHVRSGNALGATPEEAAWPLPPNVRMVGRGDAAKGRIATKKPLGGMGAVDLGRSRTPLIIAGLIGAFVLAKRYLR